MVTIVSGPLWSTMGSEPIMSSSTGSICSAVAGIQMRFAGVAEGADVGVELSCIATSFF